MSALSESLVAAQRAWVERKTLAEYVAKIQRDAEDEQHEWELFHADLNARRPVSERRLPMADHE